MVFTPRRRRLFRAIFVGVIFTGAVLLVQRWNSVKTFSGSASKYPRSTTRYRRDDLGGIYHPQQDVNATKVLKVDTTKQDIIVDATKKPNITWIKHPWKSSLRGFLNVHVWFDWCGSTVNDLRRNIHFPKYPDVRLKTNLFHVSHDAHNFGQRVFGFLHPPRTGHYTFAISADDSSELWLSSDDEPYNARLIAWVGNLSDPSWQGIVGDGQFTKYKTQISEGLFLRRNKRYFVEALHKQSSSNDHLLVAWKMPHIGNFTHITRGRISQYIHPHELRNLEVTSYARHIPLTPGVLQEPITPRKLKDKISTDIESDVDTDTKFHHFRDSAGKEEERAKSTSITNNLKDLMSDGKSSRSIGDLMYPSCDYKPSYKVDFKVARYEGVYLIHETAVYPNDGTHLKHVEHYKPCFEMRSKDSHGEWLPHAEQYDLAGDEFDPYGLRRGREDENSEINSEDRENNVGESNDNVGNIPTVDYAQHRRVRDAEESFKGRKILAILGAASKTTGDSRVMGLSRDRKVTSASTHDKSVVGTINNIRGRKPENTVVTQRKGNSRKSVVESVRKSAETLDSNARTSSRRRVRKVENVRMNSAATVRSKQALNNGHDVSARKERKISDQGTISLRKSAKPVTRISTSRIVAAGTASKRPTRNKMIRQNIKNPRMKQDVKSLSNKDNDTSLETRDLPVEGVYVIQSQKIARKDDRIDISTPRIETEVNKSNVPKVWHRKRPKERTAGNIFVDKMSPLAPTLRKLKETGQWKEIQAYAKKNNLLFTKKTWMYVTWKFLRYEKPKKPHDKLTAFVYKQNPSTCRTDGNILLNEKVAESIVNKYMKDVQKRYGRDVYVKRVINLEENHDVIKGDRYLIELELGVTGKNKTINISDFVYLPLAGKSFCFPQNFVWKKNVTVHVIVPVKDQGKWVQHFINDMSELYETTQDPNVNVIIVDFNSTDIDIKRALRRSSLKRYQFLQVNGSFQRALGIQIGAEAVKNPDDIVFTCDLHLDIPNNMIDVLRKHCIQGKMAFSPMVIRLDCGFTPSLPYGEWETMGYGLFAIYKSDFDRIGGMNVDEFKTKWGGEDWEMVDRCLQKGMEIERLRVPNFFHYFHSKQGMWGSYGFEDSVSGNNGDNMVEDELVPVYVESSDNAMGYSYNQPLMPEF